MQVHSLTPQPWYPYLPCLQAFSDFLFFVIGSNALLSELTIAVFDSVSGGVELYKGHHYPLPDSIERQRSNFITIKYVPGHYQALVSNEEGLSLDECVLILDQFGINYVISEGQANV